MPSDYAPKADAHDTNDPKVDGMQHDTNVKQTDSVETMQVGRIYIHYPSPTKTMQKNCDDRGCVSAPSKSWFSIVEEEDVVGITITPTQARKEPIHQDVTLSEQKMLSSESVGDYPVSPMLQAAATENSLKMLLRQVSGVISPCSPCTLAHPSQDSDFMTESDQYCKKSIDKSMDPINPSSMHSDEIGTGVFLGGRYSEKEVISFGGISEGSQRGVRSSNRIRDQPNANATRMERAQQQASARDPSSFSGKRHLNKFTLAYFSDDVVVRRAAALGISLGRTSSQVLQSVQLLK
jgi:hypothetical protein